MFIRSPEVHTEQADVGFNYGSNPYLASPSERRGSEGMIDSIGVRT